jgi:hypothetical protein
MLRAVSSITNAIGALNYRGIWNASTNTPSLTSGVGTKGDYYVVSVAGSTSIDGISNWGVGDWIAFNGTAWQRLEGGADGNFVNLTASGDALIGVSTTSGDPSSTKLLVASIHRSVAGDVVAANNTDTNLFTLPNSSLGVWVVALGISGGSGAPSFYNPVALITSDGTSLIQTNLVTATNMTISVSGLVIRGRQTTGAANTIAYRALRIG